MKNRVKCLRQQKGLSQQELADLVNVSRQTLSSLENGRYNPSVITSYKIARVLECDYIEDLFFLDEEVSSESEKENPSPSEHKIEYSNGNTHSTG